MTRGIEIEGNIYGEVKKVRKPRTGRVQDRCVMDEHKLEERQWK